MRRAILLVLLLVTFCGVVYAQPTPPKPLCVVDYTPGEDAYCAPNDPCGAYLETGTAATRGDIHWCNPADNLFDLVQQYSRTGKAGEVAFTEDPVFTDVLEVCDAATDTCVKLDCSSGTMCELTLEGLSTEELYITNDAGRIVLEPCDGGGACGGTTSELWGKTHKLSIGHGTAADVQIQFDLDTDRYLTWDESDDQFEFTDDLEITGSVDPTAYCKAPAEAIDADQDTNDEIAVDATEETVTFDFDSDGTIDYRIGKGLSWYSYDCLGDSVPSEMTQTGTQVRHEVNVNWGLCRGYTTAAANSDFIGGFFYSNGSGNAYDPQNLRVFEARVASEQATDYIMQVGAIKAATSGNAYTIQRGLYFVCATAGMDIDGNGAAGSANDLNWWAVATSGDTDHTGDICATLSGVQCATYTAVNTEAWNTEVSCDDIDQFWELAIVGNAAGSSYAFYVDGTLEATFTTYVPTTTIDGAGVWLETTAAAIKYMHTDYYKIAHD
jgi:hypothetical protein